MTVAPTAAAATPDNSALIEFNKRFRDAGEVKDATERKGKDARKAAGKAALKKMLAERTDNISTRKALNREAESAAEKEMLASLNGESWGRVVSLVDIHSGGATAAHPAGGPATAAGGGAVEKKVHHAVSHKAGESIVGDTGRMKDLLIALKTKPIATA